MTDPNSKYNELVTIAARADGAPAVDFNVMLFPTSLGATYPGTFINPPASCKLVLGAFQSPARVSIINRFRL